MKVKKWTSLLLASAMVFSLTACGNSKDATADISGANVDTGVDTFSQDAASSTYDDIVALVNDSDDLVVYTNVVSDEAKAVAEKRVYGDEVVNDKDNKDETFVDENEYDSTITDVDSNMVLSSNVTFTYKGKTVSYPFDLDIFDDEWVLSNNSCDLTVLSKCHEAIYYMKSNDLNSLTLKSYDTPSFTFENIGAYSYLKACGVYQLDYYFADNDASGFLLSLNDIQLTTASFRELVDMCVKNNIDYSFTDYADIDFNSIDGDLHSGEDNHTDIDSNYELKDGLLDIQFGKINFDNSVEKSCVCHLFCTIQNGQVEHFTISCN